MKKLIVAVALLGLLVPAGLLTGCAKKVPSGAIAAVGDGVVTQKQYDDIWAQATAQYETQGMKLPEAGTADFKQLRASIVSYLVQNEVIKQQAKDMNVEVTDKEYDARMKLILDQVGGQKKLDKLLSEQGVTMKELKEQLMAQLLQDEVQQKVFESIKVSDDEMKKYYDNPENKSQFVVAETATARHILVNTKALADKVRGQLLADGSDASWKKLAKEYSKDPGTKNSGGELGARPKGSYETPFDKAVNSLKLNTISEPVKTTYGYHVIEVTARTKGSNQTFEEAKKTIEQTLEYQKQSTTWTDWLKKATEDAEVAYAADYNPEELTASPSPSASAPAEASPAASASPASSASPK